MATYEVETDNGTYEVDTEEPTQPSGFSGLLSNAGQDIKGMANSVSRVGQGILDLPSDAYQTGKQMMGGKDFSSTPLGQDAQTVAGAVNNAPAAILRQFQEIGAQPLKYIPGQTGDQFKKAYPGNPFYDHPVNTAMALSPLAKPAAAAVADIANPILKGAGWTGKKLFSTGFGVSEDAIDARLKNPESIKNAAPVSDLQHNLSGSLEDLSRQISESDKSAWETLSKSYTPSEMGYFKEDRAIPKETVQDILNNTKKELSVYGGGVVGKAGQQAIASLNQLAEDISNVGKYSGGKIRSLLGAESSIPKNVFLPETTVKGIIQSLDQNINWADQTAQPLNSALENARTKLDDILKRQNPSYAKAMIPVAEKMQLLKDAQRQFNIKSVPGEGLQPGTATQANLNNAFGKNKSILRGTLQQVGKQTGEDIYGQLRNAKYAEEFKPGMRANGSRRTAMGAAIGTGIGKFTGSPATGAAIGAAGGFMLDTQGGAIAGKILDTISRYQPEISKWLAPETIRAIKEAVSPSTATSAEGATIGALTNENLRQKDPDFQQVIQQGQNSSSKPLFQKTPPTIAIKKAAELPPEQRPQPKKYLDEKTARLYLDKAGGDKEQARAMAKQEGWTVA